jgi:hypothetical protein
MDGLFVDESSRFRQSNRDETSIRRYWMCFLVTVNIHRMKIEKLPKRLNIRSRLRKVKKVVINWLTATNTAERRYSRTDLRFISRYLRYRGAFISLL